MRLAPLQAKLGYSFPSISKPHVTPSLHSPAKVTLTTSATVSNHSRRSLPGQPFSPNNWDSFLEGHGTVRLGRQWHVYQGARNWDGLLNPLDDNLRSEILRYGCFVEAAYQSFDFDPSSPSYATCRFSKKELLDRAGFPYSGYKVTKNLRATSGIQMPRWTEKAGRWATVDSSWIGYVAVCTDKSEIQRLGRRDVVIAFRGTATCMEWLENIRATLTRLPGASEESGAGVPMVENGFLSLYTSGSDTCPSLQEMVRKEIKKILETYKGEEISLTISGHSLGAALGTLAAYDLKTAFKGAVTVISFGGPRVGNRSFRCHVERQGTKILRIVNPGDVVTKLPGFVMEEEERWGPGEWFQKLVEDTQWGYAEVGRELRLTGVKEEETMSPYFGNMNLAKSHELKTYLSLVGNSGHTSCRPSLSRII